MKSFARWPHSTRAEDPLCLAKTVSALFVEVAKTPAGSRPETLCLQGNRFSVETASATA